MTIPNRNMILEKYTNFGLPTLYTAGYKNKSTSHKVF